MIELSIFRLSGLSDRCFPTTDAVRPWKRGGSLSAYAISMLRKLRIAFSAVCGIVCLMLIVLLVRSYFRFDNLSDGFRLRSTLRLRRLRGEYC